MDDTLKLFLVVAASPWWWPVLREVVLAARACANDGEDARSPAGRRPRPDVSRGEGPAWRRSATSGLRARPLDRPRGFPPAR